MANLSEGLLRAAFGLADANDDQAAGAAIEQQAAPVRQALAFSGSVPDLGSLLGDLGQQAQQAATSAGQAVASAGQAVASAVPSLEGLLGSLAPTPTPASSPADTTPAAPGA